MTSLKERSGRDGVTMVNRAEREWQVSILANEPAFGPLLKAVKQTEVDNRGEAAERLMNAEVRLLGSINHGLNRWLIC